MKIVILSASEKIFKHEGVMNVNCKTQAIKKNEQGNIIIPLEHSVRFSLEDRNIFEQGCFIDEDILEKYIKEEYDPIQKRKANFKEYFDMWNYEKQTKLKNINKKLADLELTKSSILAMKDLIEKDLI